MSAATTAPEINGLTVPQNEFIDGVSIATLGLGRTKAVQGRRFAVI